VTKLSRPHVQAQVGAVETRPKAAMFSGGIQRAANPPDRTGHNRFTARRLVILQDHLMPSALQRSDTSA
jgi:hypothetical protein